MESAAKSNLHLLTDYRRMGKLLRGGAVFCAVDTETTGLKPCEDRVIEIGAVRFDAGGTLGTFSALVNPGILIPPFCQELTGITNKMLFGQGGFGEISGAFLEFLGQDAIIVAHNAQFDLRFLNAELERIGSPPLGNKAIDTLRFSRWTFPENERWTLQSLAKQLGIEVRNAHRAEDDARVCMEIFRGCIEGSMDRQKGL